MLIIHTLIDSYESEQKLSMINNMEMSNSDGQYEPMQKPSMFGSKRIKIGLAVFLILGLLAIAVVIVVSLIPVFFENTATSSTTSSSKESNYITNTYASTLNLTSTQNTTVTDTASVARQLETAAGLTSNSINVYDVQFTTDSSSSTGRRRRDLENQRNKRQSFQCNSRALSQNFTRLLIKLTIVYPKSCGVSLICKQKFLTNAQSRLGVSNNFPLQFTFADGRPFNFQVMFCNSVVESTSPGTSGVTTTAAGATSTTSGTTTTTTTVFTPNLFQQQALAQTNVDRAVCCAPAMILDADITAIAQTYAQKLCDTNTFVHSGNTYQGNWLGENIWDYGGSGQTNINSINEPSEILEQAYRNGDKYAYLEEHTIDLTEFIQFRTKDPSRRRPIKRVLIDKKSLLKPIKELGHGAFGTVYLGTYGNSQVIAYKVIRSSSSKEAMREANILKTLSHPNIVRYIDVIPTANHILLVMEYIDGGTMFKYIRKTSYSNKYWSDCKKMMIAVAFALNYLSEKHIIHADLKSDNILLKSDNTAVLSDFGLSKVVKDSDIPFSNAARGAIRWWAPELCASHREPPSYSSDVWAYGCVLLEIITKKYPWEDFIGDNGALMDALADDRNIKAFEHFCYNLNAPDNFHKILRSCCSWSKNHRPNFKRIINDFNELSSADSNAQNKSEVSFDLSEDESYSSYPTPRLQSEQVKRIKVKKLSMINNMDMSNSDGQYEPMQKPSMFGSKRIKIGLAVFLILGLLAIAVVIVVSLIPVFFENTATSSATSSSKESNYITNTYASTLNLTSTQNTTVTNTASVARQLETAAGLTSNSINVYDVQFTTDSSSSTGRRRRDLENQRNKRQSFQCNSRALNQNFTRLLIKLTIVYPKSCGVSQICKQKFLTNAQSRLATSNNFPLLFTFADGRPFNFQVMFCNSVVESTSPGTSGVTTAVAGATSTTSGTTTTTTTVFTPNLFQQQALAQTNVDRAAYCAPAMTLDADITAIAQTYAQKLCDTNTFVHSGNTYQGNWLGENIWDYGGSGQTNINSINGSSPVEDWFSEYVNYNWASPGFASNTGHFTQTVWVGSTRFGIGICCTADNTTCYVVGNYYPGGNVGGSYPQNVLQPPCSGK
ncbi:unnamed protein product [Adineta ricciae]|uniref:Protein kinase domain-containing protein n=1 Tax=Adineta ricciae TaxID=249248 RepID=A0A814VM12_ADIRI|nr:unnamed protein product [Adineta ricciae]